jgi:hypothetical protein
VTAGALPPEDPVLPVVAEVLFEGAEVWLVEDLAGLLEQALKRTATEASTGIRSRRMRGTL